MTVVTHDPVREPPTRADRRAAWRLCLGVLAAYTLITLADWPAWGVFATDWPYSTKRPPTWAQVLAILVTNVVPAAVAIGVSWGTRLALRTWRVRLTVLAPTLAVTCFARAHMVSWLRPIESTVDTLSADFVFGLVSLGSVIVVPLLYVDARTEGRRRDRAAAETVHALEREELRTRRSVSALLHGTVQQRLVILAARLDDLAERYRIEGLDDATTATRALAAEVDELRDSQVRAASHRLFPPGLDISLIAALTVLAQQMSGAVQVTTVLTPAAEQVFGDVTRPPLTVEQRFAVLDAVSEGITNAVRHGGARAVRIELDVRPRPAAAAQGRRGPDPTEPPVLLVVHLDDDGTGPPAAAAESGLAATRARLERQGGSLALGRRPRATGARLRLTLPIDPDWADAPEPG